MLGLDWGNINYGQGGSKTKIQLIVRIKKTHNSYTGENGSQANINYSSTPSDTTLDEWYVKKHKQSTYK